MQKQYSCFFITPIGKAGSEVNEIANEVYNVIVIPALSSCNVRHLRGDENLNSNHIGMDVIECVRDADICLVDISYPNCNVYYELGLADALKKPVILMKEAEVNATELPADVVARKYVEYSLARGRTAESRREICEVVKKYVQELDEKGMQTDFAAANAGAPALRELIEENYALRRKMEEKAAAAPAMKLPMDLRPVPELTPVQAAKRREIIQQLNKLTDRKDRNTAEVTAQVKSLLKSLRALVGDAQYLCELQRRSHCAGTWEEYLDCAGVWLEVDIQHCVLDVSWLPALLEGVNNGFVTDVQYPLLEAVVDRVLIMSREFCDAAVIDASGEVRHYDSVVASYYRGLLAHYKYQKTGERHCLWDAESFWTVAWNETKKAKNRFDDKWKREKKIEVLLTLAQTRYLRGENKSALGNLKKAIDTMEQQKDNSYWLRVLMEDAYCLSMCLGENVKERVEAIISTRFAERAEDMMRAPWNTYKKLRANHLFVRIAEEVRIPERAVQKFEELFCLRPPMKAHFAVIDKTVATGASIDAFIKEAKEILTFYQTDVERTEHLANLIIYLLKLKDSMRNAYREHIAQQIQRVSELDSEIARVRELQEARAEIVRFCSSGKKARIDISAFKIYMDHMNSMMTEYHADSKERRALEDMEKMLSQLLKPYEDMDRDMSAAIRRMTGLPDAPDNN